METKRDVRGILRKIALGFVILGIILVIIFMVKVISDLNAGEDLANSWAIVILPAILVVLGTMGLIILGICWGIALLLYLISFAFSQKIEGYEKTQWTFI